jgi:hypothetical protein
MDSDEEFVLGMHPGNDGFEKWDRSEWDRSEWKIVPRGFGK